MTIQEVMKQANEFEKQVIEELRKLGETDEEIAKHYLMDKSAMLSAKINGTTPRGIAEALLY